jgi:transcription initiation factor IIE alpha subunit
MKISDVTCKCGAGYLRAELQMLKHPREEGRFNCSACGETLEAWDDTVSPVYRLTVRQLSPSFAALH